MPAVPELRLIPAYTHTHTCTFKGGWGQDETVAETDLPLAARWPQNKKALGLRKWVYGTAVCQRWCEIECPGQRGIYCVFNQIRLSVISLPLVFLLKNRTHIESLLQRGDDGTSHQEGKLNVYATKALPEEARWRSIQPAVFPGKLFLCQL